MENVCVLGLGYIGLPTASFLATKGFSVLGVDVNREIINKINRGEMPIVEPSLDILVKSAIRSGFLTVGLEPAPADVFIIAVPTPFKSGYTPDLSYVVEAVNSIIPHIKPGDLVILESTSPVGTTEMVAEVVAKQRPDLNISTPDSSGSQAVADKKVFFAHCPERVLPGKILKELTENDRIIGGLDSESAEQAEMFYRKFVSGNIFTTNSRSAELCKLAENAYRDVNIAFANELSLICDKIGADVWEVIELANHHPRVNILNPGPGVGGHCIAVDPWFIVDTAPEEARLIKVARMVNESKPRHVINKITGLAQKLRDPVIACLGLSFKANIDDLRESPAVQIVSALAAKEIGRLIVVEPHIQNLPGEFSTYGNISLMETASALREANMIVLLVDHAAFRKVDRDKLHEKIVVDTRGMWR